MDGFAVTSQLPPSIPSPKWKTLFLIGKVVPRIKTALPAGLPPRSRGRVFDPMWTRDRVGATKVYVDSGRPLPPPPVVGRWVPKMSTPFLEILYISCEMIEGTRQVG